MSNPRSIKRIGLLTGGGDCPGLNAVIRAVSKTAMYRHDIEVVGILNGYEGLIRNQVELLDASDVSGILTRGGTILGSNNRISPMQFPVEQADGSVEYIDATDRCLQTIEAHRLDALIVIGGDGTMACTMPIVKAGIPCIGVPKTIDNDIVGTELTFGYTTAMTTATLSLDRLHTTADSHHRVMVCELMGRNAGWLTLGAGIASGSDVILIPEIPFSIEYICNYLQERMQSPAGFSIIACAEGAHQVGGNQIISQVVEGSPDPLRLGGIGQLVAAAIEERTNFETRTTVLGHVQRGGPPVAMDRVLATRFGVAALELLMAGEVNRMVVWRHGDIDHLDLEEVAIGQRLVPQDHPMIDAARAVRTCFGQEL